MDEITYDRHVARNIDWRVIVYTVERIEKNEEELQRFLDFYKDLKSKGLFKSKTQR